MGSIREVTGTNELVQARYDYDPYGQQTQVSGTMTVDFGYTGLYYHQPSGLDFAPYRPYLPPLGRWGSRDPLGSISRSSNPAFSAEILEGPNLYIYCGNDGIDHTESVRSRIYAAPFAIKMPEFK